jgi:hypothetical protein
MTDLLDEQHAQAGLTLLAAHPDLGGGRVFDGKVPDPTPDPPWVLVYTVVEWPRDGVGTALTAEQVAVTTTWYCHCVGLTAASARAVGMLARSTLLNVRPVITGRNCGPIKQFETVPPQRDETTGRLLMDAVSVYGFMSTPG